MKIPTIDLFDITTKLATHIMTRATKEIENETTKYRQNAEVLEKLIKARLVKPDVMTEANVRSYERITIKRSQLTRLRKAIGQVQEDGKDLHDAKKRIISVTLKLMDYPNSTIFISYLRPYPKSEEANCPCKIEMVEIESAKEATEARLVPRLVCKN